MASGGILVHESFSSRRLLYVLTALPLLLAALAFSLQWRGGSPAFTDDILPGVKPPSSCFGNLLPSQKFITFPLYSASQADTPHHFDPKISIVTTTSAGLEQILPWLFYHRAIGVSSFFIFVEGHAASPYSTSVLEKISGVHLVPRNEELEERQRKSRIWEESWLEPFFHKPCNHELFVKQNLNMEMAIVMAREAGMDWIIHLDTDELVHPAGSPNYTLTSLLAQVPADVEQVIWHNFESSVEKDSVEEPFTEVTLFKKNMMSLPKETAARFYSEAARGNPTYFLTYSNGKSAARVKEDLRPNGAHRWQRYGRPLKELQLEEPVVLHYSYTRFSDLTSRKNRCGCRPTQKDVSRCFMLPFDRNAFIIASTSTDAEMLRWYQEYVVWGDESLKVKLIKRGMLTRIHAPQVIIQGLKEAGMFREALARGRA